ncbi:MAG: DALR anticodon-binding domain-containing protein [Pseudomonadota bacterium]
MRVNDATERALALTLDRFDEVLKQSRDKRIPHSLCEHVYSLAQAFAAFYSALPIATEADSDLRGSMLGLCEAVAR